MLHWLFLPKFAKDIQNYVLAVEKFQNLLANFRALNEALHEKC